MGEYADYEIERMMDAGYSPFSGRQPKGRKGKVPPDKFYKGPKPPKNRKKDDTVTAHEYPSAATPARLLQEYPEEKFDVSFFPTGSPKTVPKPVVAPTPEPVKKPTKVRILRPPLPEPGPLWLDLANDGDAPF